MHSFRQKILRSEITEIYLKINGRRVVFLQRQRVCGMVLLLQYDRKSLVSYVCCVENRKKREKARETETEKAHIYCSLLRCQKHTYPLFRMIFHLLWIVITWFNNGGLAIYYCPEVLPCFSVKGDVPVTCIGRHHAFLTLESLLHHQHGIKGAQIKSASTAGQIMYWPKQKWEPNLSDKMYGNFFVLVWDLLCSVVLACTLCS